MLDDLPCAHQFDELYNSAVKLGFASSAGSSQSAAGLTNKVMMERSFLEKKGVVLVGASNVAEVNVPLHVHRRKVIQRSSSLDFSAALQR